MMMTIIQKLIQFFSLKKYSKELRLSPLFIETSVSILAGLFMFIWGVIFFSNPLYQFSLFTKVRNAGISLTREEKFFSDIYCIGIDPEARMTLIDEEGSFTQFDLIADALNVINTYAETEKEKRIIIGIDYAFAVPESVRPFNNIRKALAAMPPNVFVVFGGLLVSRPDTLTMFRSRLMEDQLIDPLYNVDSSLIDRIFVGSIHYDRGSIRSGFENEEDIKAAIGYYPLLYLGIKSFSSLPLAMYIAGEIMEQAEDGRYDFYTDFGEGLSMFPDPEGMNKKLKNRLGKDLGDLGRQLYYNFFTGKGIARFKNHFMWLSAVSPRFENSTMGLTNYFSMDIVKKEKSPSKTEYFFITQSVMPEFLLGEGEENDVIQTPATGKNPFTYENETVMGVMSHITALSNLKHRYFITQVPDWLMILVSCIVVIIVFIFSWSKDLGKSMLFSILVVFLYVAFSFLFFCLGFFLPVTNAFAFSLMVFGLVAILRFILTTNKYELYEMVASRVFSANHMEKLRDQADWKQPKVIENAVILVLFPRKFPDFGKTEEEAQHYTKIYDKFLSLVFKTIENNDGNHLVLSMDGILGFWNIPVKDEESEKKAFACARQCLSLVGEWQTYIDRFYKGKGQTYTASFDICLHWCDCYAGCIGTGNAINYSINGFGINFAIEATLFQTGDKLNTLFLSREFYKKLQKTTEINEDDFEELSYNENILYSWKFTT
ncbi:MAG: hypothetical protein JXB88_24520 [Spirochaetales bacterium]|nr:hypothetical protein [Spirochaetales bacterium]